MKRLKFKDYKFSKHSNGQENGPITSLRVKIFILFLLIFLIIGIYDTYFEGSNSDSDKDDEEHINIPELKKSSTFVIFESSMNNNIYLRNPAITRGYKDQYLIACEEYYKTDGNISLKISIFESPDGQKWFKQTNPTIFDSNFTNPRSPQIEYVNSEYYILSVDIQSQRYISISSDGKSWTIPERSTLYFQNDSLVFNDEHVISANSTGIWLFDYDAMIETDLNLNHGQTILSNDFTNASILKVNNFKYIIAHERWSDNTTSIILTTLFFEEPDKPKTELKWDLLFIFIVLGFILLLMVVQEVSRD
jgi:hypothetical protein